MPTDKAILVTCAASYIGSHVVKLLAEVGESVVKEELIDARFGAS